MIQIDKDEKVIFAARKHWFILFAESLFIFLLLIIPIPVYIALETVGLFSMVKIPGDPVHLLTAIFAAWLLFIWIAFFVVWTDYYLDILILTNKKIIDVDQKGLFAREVSTLRLDRVQDITVEVNGIIPTLLGFGKIQIQTAGEHPEFIVRGIPDPYKIKNDILREAHELIDRRYGGTG